MDKRKDSFILYANQARQFEMLSDEEAGALIKKVYRFASGEDVCKDNLSPVAEMLYSIIEDQIIRDREKYEEKCKRNQENGKKGGAPKGNQNARKQPEKANGFENNPAVEKTTETTQNNHTDTDTDNDNDNDTDTDTDKRDTVGKPGTPSPECIEIIDFLNEQTGAKYKPTTAATQRAINGRLAEGNTVEDFKTVIRSKAEEWLHDDKMRKYLTPDTLFRPSNFEKYLQTAQAQPPKTKTPEKYPGLSERIAREANANLQNYSDFDGSEFQ